MMMYLQIWLQKNQVLVHKIVHTNFAEKLFYLKEQLALQRTVWRVPPLQLLKTLVTELNVPEYLENPRIYQQHLQNNIFRKSCQMKWF